MRIATGWPAAVALVLAHLAMATTGVREKSTTFDELSHLTAGYSYWATGDFRLNPESGTLAQQWDALPLVLAGRRFPPLEQEAWWKADVFALGYHFFYDQGNDAGAMLRSARTMAALFAAALGIVVYAWSRSLFGPTGALVSIALFAFCPTLLANGPLATTDVAAALFFAASAWALWWSIHEVTAASVLGSGVALALLCQTKLSGLLMAPVALVLVAVRVADGRPLALGRRSIRSRGAQLAVFVASGMAMIAVVVVVTWAFYRFRWAALRAPSPSDEPLDWAGVLDGAGAFGPLVSFARAHRLLPEAFVYGFARFWKLSLGRPAFLNGEQSLVGWRTFFPYCLAVKTPLPLLAVVIAGAIGAATRRETLYRTAPLWALLAVYWAAAIGSNFNIGHRHLLPTYPPMLVLAGGVACWLGSRAVRVAVAAAVLAVAVESLATWPHYLAYFNQLAGGPRHGYRHLVDSSLDWGQDLPGLARWLERNVSAGTPVYLAYFGTGLPEHYGISAKRLPGFFDHWRRRESFPLTAGVYAVSATMLQSVYTLAPGPWAAPYEQRYQADVADMRRIAATADDAERERLTADFLRDRALFFDHLRFGRLCAFLRRREPDASIGYSILIYRLTDRDVQTALYGPPAELVPDVQIAGAVHG